MATGLTTGLRKRRRIQLVATAALLLLAATALVGYAMRDGIEFFRSPSQLSEHPPRAGERFRLGGLVEVGTVERAGGEIRFAVTDGGTSLPVVFAGIPPDLFREGQGVIATGRMEGGTFVATEILAKHDEQYMPKEVADALKAEGHFHGDEAEAQPGG
ncbi:cytochrome c maturation protein CcmE [Amaricoccus sp.]|uniref:cytochrome c maturation protein CcmE n=1 Tax=Amaricoccus sp. TaxID=1872485 RepID=UPI00260448D7|nr:cytochrome c maturation protein CcmE [Amaricoccus sp.]HRO11204.1 cytochrome c maturation protein CcmE [Amaricoccus sp.]